jgi:anti-anti-sigma regulatory factor
MVVLDGIIYQVRGDGTVKARRAANGRVVFTLSGGIEAEDVKDLRRLLALETAGQQLVLDLRDVTLVNQDAVKFLAGCEADSIKLENCPAYIRVRIERVKVEQVPTNSVKGFEV